MAANASDRLAASLSAIEALVAFPTESSESNLRLVDWVRHELHARGVETFVFPNREGDKAALFATFGPAVDGGVLLSGHTDVVPVAGQAWTSDPYQLRRREARLYGRGACDMKGFLGVALAMADEFLALPLRRPVHLLLSYDEETTCLGSVDAIARFGSELPRPASVIVGEPTSMMVADTHKSVASYVTRIGGKEAHSSRPGLGVSAIQIACALVDEIYRLGANFEEGSPRFDPPRSTVSVGLIRGGAARNIVAGECTVEWEFRGEPHLPQDLALQALQTFIAEGGAPELRSLMSRADISTRCDAEVPGLRSDPGNSAEALAFNLTRSNTAVALPFATEAGRFQAAGLAVTICGPGSIDQAHQPDEFITIEQIQACIDFLRALGRELAA